MSIEKSYQPSEEEIKQTENIMTDEQAELSEQREKEEFKQQENIGNKFEKLPSTFFIYRNNDLYAEIVPEMVGRLKNLGAQEVDIISFPKGTGEETIKNWAEKSWKDFSGKFVLLDDTTKNAVSDAGYKEIYGENPADGVIRSNLDHIFKQASTIEGMRTDNLKKLEMIFSSILENKENTPETVLVVTKNILHHGNFDELIMEVVDKSENLSKEEKKEYRDMVNDDEHNSANKVRNELEQTEHGRKLINQIHQTVVEKLREVLVSVGIPNDKIIQDNYDEALNSYEKGGVNWVILDRHAESDKDYRHFRYSRHFEEADIKEFGLPMGILIKRLEESLIPNIEITGNDLKESIMKIMEDNLESEMKKNEVEILDQIIDEAAEKGDKDKIFDAINNVPAKEQSYFAFRALRSASDELRNDESFVLNLLEKNPQLLENNFDVKVEGNRVIGKRVEVEVIKNLRNKMYPKNT